MEEVIKIFIIIFFVTRLKVPPWESIMVAMIRIAGTLTVNPISIIVIAVLVTIS